VEGAKIMEDLLRFKFDQKYIIFDTETEGLNLVSSKPWQLAWIEAKGKKIVKKENRFLKWDNLNVSEDAARITGFNHKEYLAKAENPEKVYREFIDLIMDEDVIIVGQNLLGYDIYMLGVIARNLGIEIDYSFISRILDTKVIATALAKGNKTPDKDDMLTWQLRYLNYRERGLKTNQKFLLQHYEIPFDENQLHDALYDIEKNFEIFQKQLWELDV
jgi:DNA polymerase III epsilon subunit-like protein